jgi:hypothetical protein
MFKVSALHLTCLMGAMAKDKDDARYYLKGIYLDMERSMLVATNGHIMATCPVYLDRDAHWPELIAFIKERAEKKTEFGARWWNHPAELIFRPEKAPSTRSQLVSVDLRTMRIWDSLNKGKAFERYIEAMEDGQFPAWKRVHLWEVDYPASPASIKPDTSDGIGLDVSILSKVWNGPVKLATIPGHTGFLIRPMAVDAQDVQITLMPTRI